MIAIDINGERVHRHGIRASMFLTFFETCRLPAVVARRFARLYD